MIGFLGGIKAALEKTRPGCKEASFPAAAPVRKSGKCLEPHCFKGLQLYKKQALDDSARQGTMRH